VPPWSCGLEDLPVCGAENGSSGAGWGIDGEETESGLPPRISADRIISVCYRLLSRYGACAAARNPI
jgi:hypothetical protein